MPALTRVAVVQVLSAGTDWVEPYLPPQATLCSARGARDAPVAEWVVAALLGVTSRLLECARVHTWTKRSLVDLGSLDGAGRRDGLDRPPGAAVPGAFRHRGDRRRLARA